VRLTLRFVLPLGTLALDPRCTLLRAKINIYQKRLSVLHEIIDAKTRET